MILQLKFESSPFLFLIYDRLSLRSLGNIQSIDQKNGFDGFYCHICANLVALPTVLVIGFSFSLIYPRKSFKVLFRRQTEVAGGLYYLQSKRGHSISCIADDAAEPVA